MTTYTFTHKKYLNSADFAALYGLMKRDGVAEFVFYDGGVTSWQTWIDYVVKGRCWVVRVTHPDYGTTGIFWLNGFIHRTAMIHFCLLNPLTFDERVELGKQSLKFVVDTGALDSLYGLTPKPYRNVWPFMEELGFKRVGELPGACYIAKHDKYVNGVISTLDLSQYKTAKQ